MPDEQREQEIQAYSWDCDCAELATLKPIRVVPATAYESAEKQASLLAARVEELERANEELQLRVWSIEDEVIRPYQKDLETRLERCQEALREIVAKPRMDDGWAIARGALEDIEREARSPTNNLANESNQSGSEGKRA